MSGTLPALGWWMQLYRQLEDLVGFHVVAVSEPLRDEQTGESVRLIYGECGEFRADYRIAPGGCIPFAHAHSKQSEIFDVKRGSFALSIDGVEHVAGAGERLAVPPGSTHGGRNAGDDEVQIIVAFEPKLDADALFERYWRSCATALDAHRCVAKLLYLTCELESQTYDAGIPRRLQDIARHVACAIKRLLRVRPGSSRTIAVAGRASAPAFGARRADLQRGRCSRRSGGLLR